MRSAVSDMTGEEFEAALRGLGLTDPQAADLLRYKGKHRRQQVYRMRKGLAVIPEDKADMVRSWLAGYRPKDWPSGPQEP